MDEINSEQVAAIISAQSARANLGSPPRNKTIAGVEGGPRTLSGWKQEPGYLQTTERVMSYCEEIGYQLRPAGPLDKGVPGRYNASHAEKQLSVAEPHKPIGVSSEMCLDCQEYFQALASYTGRYQIVADPKVTRIFHPDGAVSVLQTELSI
ncbi:MAG: hypothetical protein EBE86_029870 [Hormoscilla sp. GUM202]|nr:hypothetical protein [Hormoscilla sp. GUM202]